MPPFLVLALSLVFTLSVALYDRQRNPKTSAALWIPFLWLTILGSRSLSMWLSLAPMTRSDATFGAEGSPLDRNFYTVLMVMGLVVLIRRRVSLVEVLRRNSWLALYLLYCGLSVLWSDYPEIASKRWIKSFGDPIMVLVVLTDAYPIPAITILLKRIAYTLLPLSVVFIKYFPELGKDYDWWTGYAFYTGVTTNKNLLGYLLFVFGLFFCCSLLGKFGRNVRGSRVIEMGIAIVLLGIIGWLFKMSDSKTPLMCLLIGLVVFVVSGFPIVRKYWGSYVTVGVTVLVVLQVTVDVTGVLVASAGRDLSLTGRTDVWESVIDLSGNPWLGTGYSSFWIGERLEKMWALYWFRPTQAHNGYLETYLNLGFLGLACLIAVIVAAYVNVRGRWARFSGSDFIVERDFARLGMAYLVCMLFYNITEATFYALNFLFIIFLIVIMESPARLPRPPVGAILPGGGTAPKAPESVWIRPFARSPLNRAPRRGADVRSKTAGFG